MSKRDIPSSIGSGDGLCLPVSSNPTMASGMPSMPLASSRFTILYLLLPETMPMRHPLSLNASRTLRVSGNGPAPR